MLRVRIISEMNNDELAKKYNTKVTHLWEYTCVFCCEDEAIGLLMFEIGTGSRELGDILVGVVCPDLAIKLCLEEP